MTRSRSHLPKNLSDLQGDAAILAYSREKPAYLEVLWRAADAGTKVRIASHLASAGDQILAGLLLDEGLSPVHDNAETRGAVSAAIAGVNPSLHQGRHRAPLGGNRRV